MHDFFAKRTAWDLTENEVTEALNQYKSKKDFIDLTVSNPTQCGISYPVSQITEAFSSIDNIYYNPSAKGMLSARQVVVDYYREKQIILNPENIFLTSSTSEAYSFLFRLLVDSGDHVLFPRPSYPLFQFLSDINDVDTSFYALKYEGSWSIDRESLLQMLIAKTKAIVSVNPNNPTGSYLKKDELDCIGRMCREKNISLISDEVFYDFSLEDSPQKISAAGYTDCLTFTLGGISKALALPQMKLSWIIVSGPDVLVREAVQRLEIIADTYLSVGTPVQNALKKLFQLKEDIQKNIQERIMFNYQYLQKVFHQSSAVRVLKSEGGWYAVICLENCQEDDLATTLLSEKSLFVHPGFFYEFNEGCHIILSLLPPVELFREGVGRLNDFLLKS